MKLEKLYLEVTRMCTLECEHCLRGDRENKYMSTKTIENILKDVKKIDKLLITGGEPLLAIRQIEAIIRIIKEKNIQVGMILIITNGTILNADVLKILKELSIISNLKLLISYDIFHYIELNRLGLLEKRNENTKVFKELFNAEAYGDYEEKSEYNKKRIEPKGRALRLSQERLDEINKMSDKKYVLSEVYSIDLTGVQLYYNSLDKEVDGVICVDVNGNIVPTSRSFEDGDREQTKYKSNINELGLINSLINYSEYYKEEYKRFYRELLLRLKIKK